MALILTNYYAPVYRADEKSDPSEPAAIMDGPKFTSAAEHEGLSSLDSAKGPGLH